MKEVIFTGKKKPEGFKIYRRKEMQELLDSFDDGTELEIVVRRKKKKRSNAQNAYYHACIVPSVYDGLIDAGYERKDLDYETVHEFLKSKFLRRDVSNTEGEFITVPQSTSELSVSQMMDYIADIQKWAQEFLNITIEDPEQQTNLKL